MNLMCQESGALCGTMALPRADVQHLECHHHSQWDESSPVPLPACSDEPLLSLLPCYSATNSWSCCFACQCSFPYWDITYLCGSGGCGIKIFQEPLSFPKHLCKLLTSKQLLATRCLTLLYYAKSTLSLFDLIPQQLHFLLPSFNSCWSQQSYGREAGLSHGVVTPHWCELLNISYTL